MPSTKFQVMIAIAAFLATSLDSVSAQGSGESPMLKALAANKSAKGVMGKRDLTIDDLDNLFARADEPLDRRQRGSRERIAPSASSPPKSAASTRLAGAG